MPARRIPDVEGFLWDDENLAKIDAHGLADWQLEQVLDHPHLIARNRRGRRAPLLLVGRDNAGVCISIPIEPTRDPGIWRPVTAWRSKYHEEAHLVRLEAQLRRRGPPAGEGSAGSE